MKTPALSGPLEIVNLSHRTLFFLVSRILDAAQSLETQ
jgi:hypothetical protein